MDLERTAYIIPNEPVLYCLLDCDVNRLSQSFMLLATARGNSGNATASSTQLAPYNFRSVRSTEQFHGRHFPGCRTAAADTRVDTNGSYGAPLKTSRSGVFSSKYLHTRKFSLTPLDKLILCSNCWSSKACSWLNSPPVVIFFIRQHR